MDNRTVVFSRAGEQENPKPEIPVIVPDDNTVSGVFSHPVKKTDVIPAQDASRELLRIRGTWPFDFAPDELVIEEKRLILKQNFFPVGSVINTVMINKLNKFELTNTLYFSALYIEGEIFNTVKITMKWLKHSDAQKAKEIVDGLLLKEDQDIKIPVKDQAKIVETVRAIGEIT